ncbi:MAG: hypothetical protein OK422_05410 [Thaumarchaeota archaeon]|nr:hypothetical protein [Nitrososphaerota archaeon]
MLRVAVDIGGTVTDLVVLDGGANEILQDKVPTITANQAEGACNSIVERAENITKEELLPLISEF